MPEPWWRLLPQSFASFRTLLGNPSSTAGAGIQRRRFSFTLRLISRYASCHHIVGKPRFSSGRPSQRDVVHIWNSFLSASIFSDLTETEQFHFGDFSQLLPSIITSTRQLLLIGWLVVAASLASWYPPKMLFVSSFPAGWKQTNWYHWNSEAIILTNNKNIFGLKYFFQRTLMGAESKSFWPQFGDSRYTV